MTKPKPRKPTSPPTTLLLPESGEPVIDSQELPSTTEEIEEHVIGVLASHLSAVGREAEVLPRPDGEWPDAALAFDGATVGVEVVEVVNHDHRRKLQGHAWYVNQFKEAFDAAGLSELLAGTQLMISDRYEGWPPARSAAAQELIHVAVGQLTSHHPDTFARCRVGDEIQFTDLVVSPYRVDIVSEKTTASDDTYRLFCDEAYRTDRRDLQRAVQNKLAQRYASRAGYDELWLVAWDSYGYLSAQRTPTDLLDGESHVFDALWTCQLHGLGLSQVHQLWPSGTADERQDDSPHAIVIPASAPGWPF